METQLGVETIDDQDPVASSDIDAPAPEAELSTEPAERLDRLVDRVGVLARELAGMRTELARAHERAAAREHVIDRLHDENERLRAGERRLLLRPVLTDLQRLRHELLRDADRLPEQFTAQQVEELLRSYAHNLELTLERGGISVVSPEPGAPYDASTQRVMGTVPTDDASRDATIADIAADGYHDVVAERAVTPAAVRVYRWTPAAD